MRVSSAFLAARAPGRRVGQDGAVRARSGRGRGGAAAPSAAVPALRVLDGRGQEHAPGAVGVAASGSRRLALGDPPSPAAALSAPRRARRGRALRAAPVRVHPRLRVPDRVAGRAYRQSAICRLLRVDWDTVGRIVERVCADEFDPDRLSALYDRGDRARTHHALRHDVVASEPTARQRPHAGDMPFTGFPQDLGRWSLMAPTRNVRTARRWALLARPGGGPLRAGRRLWLLGRD